MVKRVWKSKNDKYVYWLMSVLEYLTLFLSISVFILFAIEIHRVDLTIVSNGQLLGFITFMGTSILMYVMHIQMFNISRYLEDKFSVEEIEV